MSLSWCRKLVNAALRDSGLSGRLRPKAKTLRLTYRPLLEQFEQRLVPTTLSIPTNLTAGQGQTVQVPINVDSLNDPADGLSGLTGGDFVVFYNPAVFTVNPSDGSLGTISTNGSMANGEGYSPGANTNGWIVTANVLVPGELLIGLSNSGSGVITDTGSGSLVTVNFHVQTNAPLGAAKIDLAADNMGGGSLTDDTEITDQNFSRYTPFLNPTPLDNTTLIPVYSYSGSDPDDGTVNVTSSAAGPHFAVFAPSTTAAGTPFTFTVTCQTATNATATSYTGTVHFTSSDTGAGVALPADFTFLAGDQGAHVFTSGATLVTAGSQTITATDIATNEITGAAAISVVSVLPVQLPTVAKALTHSQEYYTNFVINAYETYLGRAPDTNGLNGWVSAMENGLSDEHLEAGFIGSTEYINDHGGPGAGWLTAMYQNLLGRKPAPSEVQGWVTDLNNGESPQAVAYGFAASSEREGDRVEADYMTYLGRAASQSEVTGWVNDFLNGLSNEDVIAGFVASSEFWTAHGATAKTWLDAAYMDILGRPADETAYSAWLPLLG